MFTEHKLTLEDSIKIALSVIYLIFILASFFILAGSGIGSQQTDNSGMRTNSTEQVINE